MEKGCANFKIGLIFMAVCAFYGFYLGYTIDQFLVAEGTYSVNLPRVLMRGAHSHGMLFGLYNMVIGIALGKTDGKATAGKVIAILALAALLLPIGLLLRGLTNGAMTFAPVAAVGGLSFIASLVLSAFRLSPLVTADPTAGK